MKSAPLTGSLPLAALASAALLGCSGAPSKGPNPNALSAPSGITPYVAPPASLGTGTILLSASGETLALSGFAWPPGDTAMVDGWQFTLYRYITVLADVTVWSNPNIVPSDQAEHGPAVAHVAGPWVIDLHEGGPLMGKGGGGEEAQAFGAILGMDDGDAFDPTLTYGFGFSTVAATKDVYNVNLSSTPGMDGKNDLEEYTNVMIPKGYSVLYEGVATFLGGDGCQQVTSGTVSYDFSKLPQTLPFQLGFNTPTDYVNCQNGTDLPGAGVNGEAHPRGVQLSTSSSITAQVTIHMDHPFWESFAEDSPVHWDPIAAQYLGVSSPVARTEDLETVSGTGAALDFTAFTDNAGTPIPWRTCDSGYYTPTNTGQLYYNPLEVKVTIGGHDPTHGLRNYYDYMRYTQATQGHFNSQGLCFIDRHYPSPQGGSG
jgi:hypothetical protein